MIHHITKSYIGLLYVFGFILIFGSFKVVFDPDESTYAPGQTAIMHQYVQESSIHASNDVSDSFHSSALKASIFDVPLNPSQCQ